MRFLKIIPVLFFIYNTVFCQNGAGHILKAYPNWTTNFSKHIINLNELTSGGPGKDGIPAIIHPKFISVKEASDWLDDLEPVIALKINNKTKAYPLQILLWHEIVNDELSGIPVLVTFCPLCYSALVYDRRIDKMVPTFGVSGLLRNSDLVMYDLFTESFWQQFSGEAIVGDMTGKKLKLIPSQIISFEQFARSYPTGLVLSKNTGYNRRYGINPYKGYDDINQTPVMYRGPIDDRLAPNEKVIGVKLDNVQKAYPYSITLAQKVINDSVGGISIVIFHVNGTRSALDSWLVSDSKDVGSTGVFSRVINNKLFTFEFKDDKIHDKETSSVWNVTGKCIQGKLKGTQLSTIPSGDYFSFAWFAFYPDTQVYKE